MKINKVLFGFTVAIAALLSSCNQDNEGAIYNSSNAGVSFSASTLASVAVPASKPIVTVELFRGTKADAVSGKVTPQFVLKDSKGKDSLGVISGVTVTDYNFAAGETKTTVNVDLSPIEVGEVYTLKLSLPEEVSSIGGVKTTQIKVSKAYEWKSLGTGTFTDAFVTGSDANPDGVTANVEIMKADGFDRYRVMNPYKDYLASAQGQADWGDWIAPSSPEYVEFWTEDGIILYDDFFTGLYYQGAKNQAIYACHPLGFSGVDPAHNKWWDEKTAQFAPYYYIDGVGGWNYTQKDGVIIITLP